MAALLSSCSSPPKPPVVDDSNKRPINTRAAVDLQMCRSELSRTNIQLAEASRRTLQPPAPATPERLACAIGGGLAANQVLIVRFETGSATWSVAGDAAAAIAERARDAALIVVRGRTDATVDSRFETNLARRRADVAASFLRDNGIPSERIRVTWQGAGDPMTGDPTDRGSSRRVELEFYPAAPVAQVIGNTKMARAD